jgi:hypothetical protein
MDAVMTAAALRHGTRTILVPVITLNSSPLTRGRAADAGRRRIDFLQGLATYILTPLPPPVHCAIVARAIAVKRG